VHDVRVGYVEVIFEIGGGEERAKLRKKSVSNDSLVSKSRIRTFRCIYSWPAATAL
jgi:hypothetical protein